MRSNPPAGRRPGMLLCAGCAVAMVTAANAAPIEVIYTKIATDPSSVVPGAKDLAGMPAVTNFRALEQLYGSPDGSRWAISGRTQQGSDLETIVLLGSGTSGTALSQEGQPIPTGAPGEVFDFFGSALGKFNTLNQFAYSARARGGVASVFQKVLFWNGATQSIAFQMGDLLTGMVDQSPNPSGDETFGNSIGGIHPLDNGVIGCADPTIQNVHTSRRPAAFYNKTKFQEPVVDTVIGLLGDTVETWAFIDTNTFATTPDGAHWLAGGRIVSPAEFDAVLVVDGKVVMREGFAIPGTSVTFAALFNVVLLSNGDWFARGDDPSDNDWAVRNGVLLAKTGDPITTGSSDHWGDSFYSFTGNRNGDWVLVGNTDAADPATNDVMVLNGTDVLVREGDPVDLNGNGMADDDVFIGRGVNTLSAFEPNDIFLTDNKTVYFFGDIRNAAGQDLNSTPAFGTPQAFLRLRPPCFGDLDGDGQVGAADLAIVLGSWGAGGGAADLNNSGNVDAFDLALLLGSWGPCP